MELAWGGETENASGGLGGPWLARIPALDAPGQGHQLALVPRVSMWVKLL